MNKYPMFQVGEVVSYPLKDFSGKVSLSFWDGKQWRYYVDHKGTRYSVPEEHLDSVRTVFRRFANQALAAGKNPSLPAVVSEYVPPTLPRKDPKESA